MDEVATSQVDSRGRRPIQHSNLSVVVISAHGTGHSVQQPEISQCFHCLQSPLRKACMRYRKLPATSSLRSTMAVKSLTQARSARHVGRYREGGRAILDHRYQNGLDTSAY